MNIMNNTLDSALYLFEQQGLTLVMDGDSVKVFGPKEVIKSLMPSLVGNKPKIVAELAARKASTRQERVELTSEQRNKIAWLCQLIATHDLDGEIQKAGLKAGRTWNQKTGAMNQEQHHRWIPLRATITKITKLIEDGTTEQQLRALRELDELHDAWNSSHTWRCENYHREEWPIAGKP